MLLTALLIPACGQAEPVGGEAPLGADGQAFVATHQAQVELVEVPVEHAVVGSVSAQQSAVVSAQVDGRVLSVAVEVGDRVQAGQLLVELDARAMQAQVEQAAAAKAAAAANFELAQSTLARVERLYGQEAATLEQLEQAQAAAQAAEADSARAVQAEKVALAFLSHARVQALRSGVVQDRLVDPGDMAMPGWPLLKLQTEDGLEVVAEVGERRRADLFVGMPVRLEVPALERSWPSALTEISPTADARSRSFRLKADLPADPALQAGMYAKLVIELDRVQVPAVPQAALTRVGQLETVMVQTESGWQRRFVRSGMSLPEDRIEILAGLKEGEPVAWDG